MMNTDSVPRKRLMNMASSSSAIPHPQEKYDVFISFRGVDTRDYFTSHLHKALRDKKVDTYIDNRLEKGDEISPALIKAIEQSKLSVIIFSENYASSTWCLDELVHILRCRERFGQFVIPVFCGIDPSHVRKQKGSYAVAFAQLEQRFKDRKDMVCEWKDALTKVANLSGFDSEKIRPESELVETVVKNILMKLNGESSCDLKGLVGIQKHIENIEALLCIDSLDVRIVGIWGTGGIGKTTLADVVYNKLYSKFDACCFLANVREKSENRDSLNRLRNELLGALLKEEYINIATPSIGSPFVRERLHRTKALIVLDDVNSLSQLESLVGDCDLAKEQLGTGSRIIITTRDRRLLKKRVDNIYEVKGLNFDEALHLFHLKAFRNNSTTTDYTRLSRMVVDYANGIPLALKVLGSSFLHCNNKEDWESELSKLKKDSNLDIMKVLRISYDGLDKGEKKIFLHIACLYKGEHILKAKRKLDLCGFIADSGIRVLIDMSLISVTNYCLQMHDLIQKMGWEIVREDKVGERIIIWTPEDARHVLQNKTGTEKVEAISLDTSMIEELQLGRKVFKTMYNLKLLNLYNPFSGSRVCVPDQGLQCLPDALTYLHWDGFPQKSLPSKFSPCNLVELHMRHSKVEKLWNKGQNIRNLKKIDLSSSKQLTEVPDLSRCQNIKYIDLNYCTSLVEIPSYFKKLDKLEVLNVDCCSNLKHLLEIPTNIKQLQVRRTAIEELPSSVWTCKKLRFLGINSRTCCFLDGCSSLGKVSELPRNITTIDMMGSAIEVVSSSTFESLSRLVSIDLRDCKRLVSLPSNLCKLKYLEILYLSGCSKFEGFPEILEPMECLKHLDLSGTAVKELSIENLNRLHTLSMDRCGNLESLRIDRCGNRHLQRIYLSGTKIESLPANIKQVSALTDLDISNCKSLRSLQLQDLPLNLEFLKANGCTSLETVSGSKNPLIPAPQLVFSDCLKLDQNSRSYLLMAGQHAPFGTRRYISPQLGICCPGNEIPKWFSYQTEGSSINTQLPLNWLHSNFIQSKFLGFLLCAVVASHKFTSARYFTCESHFQNHNGECLEFNFNLGGCDFVRSDHLLMWYYRPSHTELRTINMASFSFFVVRETSFNGQTRGNIKKCGMHLLYA